MGLPITKRTIHVYSCITDPSRKYVALIDQWPMIFKGDTTMSAKRAADEWRRKAVLTDKTFTLERKAKMLDMTAEQVEQAIKAEAGT